MSGCVCVCTRVKKKENGKSDDIICNGCILHSLYVIFGVFFTRSIKIKVGSVRECALVTGAVSGSKHQVTRERANAAQD